MSPTAHSTKTPEARPRNDGRPSSLSRAPSVGSPGPAPALDGEPIVSDVQRSSVSPSSPPTTVKRTPTTNRDNAKVASRDGVDQAKNAKGTLQASPSPAAAQATLHAAAALDPLSQHILMRTNSDNAGSPRLRYPGRPDSPAPDAAHRFGSEVSAKPAGIAPTDTSRDKKKGASFLSRLSMRARKRDDDLTDDASEIGEPRLSGSDAHVFSSVVGAGGYLPHHKEPPRYIKVRAHHKKKREFNRMFLAQQLVAEPAEGDNGRQPPTGSNASGTKGSARTRGAIWAMEFSKDGKYLAAAGKDHVVRIWSVISTPEERRRYEEEENASNGNGSQERLSAPVFRGKPLRELHGHAGEVLDLSWSKNNFLLSSSMDKTVRLWHASRSECLCAFNHKDFVTSIAFHPMDDRFFLAGSLDCRLRLWSIPDKAVAYSAQLPDMITAVAFSPDGRTSIAGVFNGTCLFYETEGLRLVTQMLVRSSRGKNAKGSKITGIKTMTMPLGSLDGEVKVLVTSNDSRVRLYSMGDKTVDIKLKGHENLSSQIHARFSDDARHVICGSEDKRAFVWSLDAADPDSRDKVPYEWFDAHSTSVSAACFAPTKSRQLLSASGDPLYDLCNPPPVKLMSLDESRAASQSGLSDDSKPAVPPPQTTMPKESPAYIEKSKHPDGNIIVTADQTGVIKVFRQDCAHAKRRQEVWETGSSFSKKLVGQGNLLGRSGSIITRTSASSVPHSRRTSISQSQPGGAGAGLATAGQSPHMSTDHINKWRHGIDSGRNSMIGSASIRSDRSMSPSRLSRSMVSSASAAGAASEARRQQYASPLQGPAQGSQLSSPNSSESNVLRVAKRGEKSPDPRLPPTPSFSLRPADGSGEDVALDPTSPTQSFWNLNRWKGVPSSLRNSSGPGQLPKFAPRRISSGGTTATPTNNGDGAKAQRRASGEQGGTLAPKPSDTAGSSEDEQDGGARDEADSADDRAPYAGARLNSVVSKLSSEYTSDGGEERERRRCPKCGSREFKTKTMAGKPRVLCSKCGRVLEDQGT